MIWQIIGLVFLAGAIGGVINALLTDNGFILPKYEDASGNKIWRPGVVGNVLIGAVAAVISWGLYGPFSDFIILPKPTTGDPSTGGPNITVAAFVGAILVGVAGAKWLSNEVDKKLLKAAASAAAAGQPSAAAPAQMMAVSPANALRIAQSLNN
jgi:O-antigen/teichoic acid export membrane protein